MRLTSDDCTRLKINPGPLPSRDAMGYSWAATYSAGSDAFVYRRFKGELPEHARKYERLNPPARIVAFCEENSCDVALYDELKGVVRKPRLGTDEAP